MTKRRPRPKKKPVSLPRPTDEELAEMLRGTSGRCFSRQGKVWRDIVTGAVGDPEDLEQAWLAEVAQ